MEPGSKSACRWHNINNLLVLLQEKNVHHPWPQALTVLAISLEDNINKQKKKHEVTADIVIKSLVPAACLWFSNPITAAKILEACHEGRCANNGAHGALWDIGEKREEGIWSRGGYSMERWQFWRQRLEDIPKQRYANEQTAELCRAALEVIGAVQERTAFTT